ncbi:MAG: hypothetical protein IJM50_00955 [Lachnospiraceae bacterium]|nr:hypothetical protein [Lachnospiraceae bacterium]
MFNITHYGPGFVLGKEQIGNKERHKIYNSDQTKWADLTPRYYEVLATLMENYGVWLDRSFIFQKLRLNDETQLAPTIYHIRDSMEAIGVNGKQYIKTSNGKVLFDADSLDMFPSLQSIGIISEILFPGGFRPEEPGSTDSFCIERAALQDEISILMSEKRIVGLSGHPGSGKSTFLRQFVSRYDDKILASFFCNYDVSTKNDLINLLKELAYQIVLKDVPYREYLWRTLTNMSHETLIRMNCRDWFDLTFKRPVINKRFTVPGIVVIDALDECENSSVLVSCLKDIAGMLPETISFLISFRGNLLKTLDKQTCSIIRIDAENNQYIRKYIDLRLESKGFSEEELSMLSEKCADNFLFAKYVCDDILSDSIGMSSVPGNLDVVYYCLFRRLFSNSAYTPIERNALAVMLALKTPADHELLSRILNVETAEVIAFTIKISDILRDPNTAQTISFFHKSISDWIQQEDKAHEYHINPQEGCGIIWKFIYESVKNNAGDVPYTLFRDWLDYGKASGSKKEYRELIEDDRLLVETIRQYRLHSEFGRALHLVEQKLRDCELDKSRSLRWLNYYLAYNDILIDLKDPSAIEQLEKLLKDTRIIASADPILKNHLYQNYAWVLMECARYVESKEYYQLVFKEYENIAWSIEKKWQYAHTLYVYANLLAKMGALSECETQISRSISMWEELGEAANSLEYSLCMKQAGELKQREHLYHEAESLFLRALQIQESIFTDRFSSHYIAHTLMTLADNELKLLESGESIILQDSLQHVRDAIAIYQKLNIRHFDNLSECRSIEKRLSAAAKNGK